MTDRLTAFETLLSGLCASIDTTFEANGLGALRFALIVVPEPLLDDAQAYVVAGSTELSEGDCMAKVLANGSVAYANAHGGMN